MAYIKPKLKLLEKALKSWEKVLNEPFSDIVRDATIQRYEYTFELLWKTIKVYLKQNEAIICNSPRSCFREARQIMRLTDSEVELCLQMAQDRNLSVHTYSEKLAKQLYNKTKKYYQISQKIFQKISVSC